MHRAINFGGVFDRQIDATSSISFRAYSGNRTNTHFNNVTSTPPTFVGLDRDYKGIGLEYKLAGKLFEKETTSVFGFSYDKSSEISTKGKTNSQGESYIL